MERLDELIGLTRRVGEPAADLVILAEGNTSCTAGAGRFWVKASGHKLEGIGPDGFVLCEQKALADAKEGDMSDQEVESILLASRSDASHPKPSVEAFMHAWLLGLDGVEWVVHTHPPDVLALMCRHGSDQFARTRLFPDEVVCCGPASAWVPYVDPGYPLAREIQRSVTGFIERWGEPPKVVLMENHGLLTTGRTSEEALAATLMACKAAKVLLGALSSTKSLDEIKPLGPQMVDRIRTRPDEHYRQSKIWKE